MSSLVSFHNLGVGYKGTIVLAGVNACVHSGEALALVGPNGSGKTTLLKSLTGSVEVLDGQILGASQRVGYVPQSAELDLSFPVTVEQVVMMGLCREIGWARFPKKAHWSRVKAVLEHVGLADIAKKRFGELSGGQRQRILLARALVGKPDLILLDEPFNGLDQPNRDALLRIIREAKSDGVAIIVSTHDLSLAHSVCDTALVLAGRQVAFGPVREVLVPEIMRLAYGGDDIDALALDRSGMDS